MIFHRYFLLNCIFTSLIIQLLKKGILCNIKILPLPFLILLLLPEIKTLLLVHLSNLSTDFIGFVFLTAILLSNLLLLAACNLILAFTILEISPLELLEILPLSVYFINLMRKSEIYLWVSRLYLQFVLLVLVF